MPNSPFLVHHINNSSAMEERLTELHQWRSAKCVGFTPPYTDSACAAQLPAGADRLLVVANRSGVVVLADANGAYAFTRLSSSCSAHAFFYGQRDALRRSRLGRAPNSSSNEKVARHKNAH
jgi:hypothetical protein